MRKLPRNRVRVLGLMSFLMTHGCTSEFMKEDIFNPTNCLINQEETAACSPEVLHNQAEISQEPEVTPSYVLAQTCQPMQEINSQGTDHKYQLLAQIYGDGLSLEKAVQLALVNNPELYAYYENLDIGYAGLLEAGLRQNPVVSSKTRFPDEPGLMINREFDTAINFLDFFLIPLRQRAAEAEILVIESEIGQKVLDLVMEVDFNWLDLKILQRQLGLEAERIELKELAAGLSVLQKKAGNINALMARNKAIQHEMALEKLKSLEADRETATEKMNRSLGLFGNEACWVINGDLDWKHDPALPDLATLENAAIENRPDLEIIRREINALAQNANLKQWWTYSNIKVGVSKERDTDGTLVAGPSIELEVPIFNYGQAEQQKYHALIDQAQKRLLAKAIEACSQVREFLTNAHIFRAQLEKLENIILPDLQKQITDGQAYYNVMTLGIYDLFDIKEAHINAQLEYLEALKNYKKATIELVHAIGGSFTRRSMQ